MKEGYQPYYTSRRPARQLAMALRATTIILATAAFARLGLGEIGFLLGVAMNLVPLIQSTSASVLLARRLRGGFRRNRLQSLKRMVVTILVNSLRHSEDIVCAAAARAFNGVGHNPVAIQVNRADMTLFVTAAAFLSSSIVLWLLLA